MKQVYRYDKNGSFIEPMLIVEGEPIPSDCTDKELPQPCWKPIFKDGEWIETATDEERNPQVNIVKSDIDILKERNEELNLQIIELWETLINGGLI